MVGVGIAISSPLLIHRSHPPFGEIQNIKMKDKIIKKLISKIEKEIECLISKDEAYNLFIRIKETNHLKGDIAEIGCYIGGSSKVICEAKGNKKLFLFDTFEGLPKLSKEDDQKKFKEGKYNASLKNLKEYLKQYSGIKIYRGLFPSNSKPISNKKFSFIHLDLDLYKSTLDSLEFFYKRMSKGGIIITHDYTTSKGVRKAFDDFFKDKEEKIINIVDSQGMIIKI